MDHDLTLKAAALMLGYVSEEEFDRVVDPAKMVEPYVATTGVTPVEAWASRHDLSAYNVGSPID